MILSWKRASISGLTVCAAVLGTLLAAAGEDVWSAKVDHEKRIITLEVNDKSDHELLLEMRQDLKEVRQDIKELLRGAP